MSVEEFIKTVSELCADPTKRYDLLLRFFAPPGGIDEDPVSVFRHRSAARPTQLHVPDIS